MDKGGAERQLVELAKGLASKGHQIEVLVFYGGGELEQCLIDSNIRVYHLGKTARWDVIGFLFKCYQAIRSSNPQVLHSYLVTANTIAALLKPFLSQAQIVWGVRAGNMNLENYDWVARWSYRIESWFSPFADLIICNSESGREYAAAKGFPRKKMVVIPNGIDTTYFKPDPVTRLRGRAVWGISESDFLIGLVARLDPIKGHETFLRAAAKYVKNHSKVRFICVGDGPADYTKQLQQMSLGLGLGNKVIWTGGQRDMVMVYNALDVMTSASYGEGFPNVVGEAMACGIPCVVTAVGDSAQIVAETGKIVAPYDEDAMAAAWTSLDADARQTLGALARVRICKMFSCESLVEKTENLLFRQTSKDWVDLNQKGILQ
ncbi:MAG: glycosyltransferase [Acidobacteria bacterium]|nr:glycosyltransferase [Acidobacteriota bacterium]